jgi:hypothetical protein
MTEKFRRIYPRGRVVPHRTRPKLRLVYRVMEEWQETGMSFEPTTSMPPDDGRHIVVIRLGDTRIALHLSVVERVIRAVAVTPVADAPF